METVEVVKTHKNLLLAANPNPLPLLAGADLFEQFLTKSLQGQADVAGSDRVLSFDEIRSHLLQNGALFADAGHAWTRSFDTSAIKTSFGGQLSVDLVAGYFAPFTASVGAAWGHDGAGQVPDQRRVYVRLGGSF